jgi:hypothetical protein
VQPRAPMNPSTSSRRVGRQQKGRLEGHDSLHCQCKWCQRLTSFIYMLTFISYPFYVMLHMKSGGATVGRRWCYIGRCRGGDAGFGHCYQWWSGLLPMVFCVATCGFVFWGFCYHMFYDLQYRNIYFCYNYSTVLLQLQKLFTARSPAISIVRPLAIYPTMSFLLQ